MEKPSPVFTISWLDRNGQKQAVSVEGKDGQWPLAAMMCRSEAQLRGWDGDIRQDGAWHNA